MIRSENIDKILPAIFAVKKELEAVKKSASNPFHKSKYADLNTHLEGVEPLLEKHGCVLMQPPSTDYDGKNRVESIIFHVESNQYMGGSLTIEIDKPDPQKTLANITYYRRGIINSLLAMMTEDDDGNTASGRVIQPTNKKEEVKTETKPVTVVTNAKPNFGGFKPAKKDIY